MDRQHWRARPRTAAIDVDTAGDSVLIPAVAGQRVRVTSYLLIAGGDTTITFKSGAAALSGPIDHSAGGGEAVAGGDSPQLETAIGEPLQINLSDAVQVSGHLTYQVVS